MALKVGLLSIGQAPVPGSGVMSATTRFLNPDAQVVWAGALDGLTREQVAAMVPGPTDYALITRLADRTPVTVAKHLLIPLMQRQIDRMEADEQVDATLILCTGEFPAFRHRRLLLEPERVIMGMVSGLLTREMRLGVLIPLPEQVGWATDKWRPLCREVKVIPVTPYGSGAEPEACAAAVQTLGDVDLIIMDCMGYTDAQKQAVQAATGRPVVLSVTAVARVLGELF